jgi:hypothetical protein
MYGDFFLAAILPILALSAGVLLLAAALLQWLWNMTMPEAFGLRTIRYWIAFRLILITTLLGAPAVIHVK